VDKILLQLQDRGEKYLDQTVVITNFFSLMSAQQIQRDFTSKVVGAFSNEVEHAVSDMIDWIIEKNDRLRKQVSARIQEALATQTSSSKLNLLSKMNITFDQGRQELLQRVLHRGVEPLVQGYDKTQEAEKLSKQVVNSVYRTAVVEVGALGIGAVLASLVSIDFSGILPFGLAVSGLFILPYQRRALKRDIIDKVTALRTSLSTSLRYHFESETRQYDSLISTSIKPYESYVIQETKHLQEIDATLKQVAKDCEELRLSIQHLFPSQVKAEAPKNTTQ